eukprot:7996294-Pyramimonas_sp.AAC.1
MGHHCEGNLLIPVCSSLYRPQSGFIQVQAVCIQVHSGFMMTGLLQLLRARVRDRCDDRSENTMDCAMANASIAQSRRGCRVGAT